MEMIKQRLTALRNKIKEQGLNAFLLLDTDYHGSSYPPAYYSARKYFSGFTGSYGILALLEQGGALYTDGRYFLQAEEQLRGSGLLLLRKGEPDSPDLFEYLCHALPPQSVVGADMSQLSAQFGCELLAKLSSKDIALVDTGDLCVNTYINRPPLPDAPVFTLPVSITGKTAQTKLKELRAAMQTLCADAHVLSTLDDIAWLYNIRGGDIAYNPLTLCYSVIERETAYLFIDQSKLSPALISELSACGVQLLPYGDIYSFLSRYKDKRVLVDKARINFALYNTLLNKAEIIHGQNPTILLKAVKNDTEIANMKLAHIKDGVALLKFFKYLSENPDAKITELSASQKLLALRQEQGALYESFQTIMAYGAHAALPHYTPTEGCNAPLLRGGMLLIDSGGQYYEGTTDVTRVVALGAVPKEQKLHFTLALKGMLRLSAAKFPRSLTTSQLDVLARAPLWRYGLDYNHGTGHGIGSFLCVHEPPIRVNYRDAEGQPLLPGMVLSDEPGVYMANSHGVRLENLLVVKNAPGLDGFLEFEPLTRVYFDISLLIKSLLNQEEIDLLNAYHALVYEELSAFLTPDERVFLREATKSISL